MLEVVSVDRFVRYTWFQNSVPKAATSSRSGELHIVAAREEDSGEYYCVVERVNAPDLFVKSSTLQITVSRGELGNFLSLHWLSFS